MEEEQPRQDVTGLHHAWRGGDQGARQEPVPLLNRELHRIAKHYIAAQPEGHTLQTAALVNEAYLHLIDGKRADWLDRAPPTSWQPISFLAECCR